MLFFKQISHFHTLSDDVVALAEETETVTAGTTTQSSLYNTRQGTSVGRGDVVGVSSLVAAGDIGIIATLVLSLLDGGLVVDGEPNTVTGVRHSYSSDSEDKYGGEDLHFDGFRGCLVARSGSKK